MDVYDVKGHDEPVDRLTRICEAAVNALRAHPEFGDDVRAIVMLSDDMDGGIVIDGYDDNSEAVSDVFTHVKALLSINGTQMEIITIGADGEEN